LTIWQCILSAELTKTHFFKLCFWRFAHCVKRVIERSFIS